jgi:hypothetical protein
MTRLVRQNLLREFLSRATPPCFIAYRRGLCKTTMAQIEKLAASIC